MNLKIAHLGPQGTYTEQAAFFLSQLVKNPSGHYR
jgi:prephenate dehydratase